MTADEKFEDSGSGPNVYNISDNRGKEYLDPESAEKAEDEEIEAAKGRHPSARGTDTPEPPVDPPSPDDDVLKN